MARQTGGRLRRAGTVQRGRRQRLRVSRRRQFTCINLDHIDERRGVYRPPSCVGSHPRQHRDQKGVPRLDSQSGARPCSADMLTVGSRSASSSDPFSFIGTSGGEASSTRRIPRAGAGSRRLHERNAPRHVRELAVRVPAAPVAGPRPCLFPLRRVPGIEGERRPLEVKIDAILRAVGGERANDVISRIDKEFERASGHEPHKHGTEIAENAGRDITGAAVKA